MLRIGNCCPARKASLAHYMGQLPTMERSASMVTATVASSAIAATLASLLTVIESLL